MTNRTAISFCAPLHFLQAHIESTSTSSSLPYTLPYILYESLSFTSWQIPQYQSRHMEDYWLEERLNKWQSLPGDRWCQPWRNDDIISLQVQNNIGQIEIDIINCQKTVLTSFLMTQKQQDQYEPDYFIYESNTALDTLPEGYAWMLLKIGVSPVRITLISEPLLILADQPGTLLIEYSHYKFYENLIFEGGFTSSIRTKGLIRKKPTAFKDTVYEDQDLDMVMIHSKPYRVWELLIGAGDDGGVPDWFEDKIGRILGCSNLRIDGRYYTKNEGAKMEEIDERFNGALYTYKIELRERINRHSHYWDSDASSNEELVITLNSTSKGFADTSLDASSSVVVFTDVE